MKILGVRHHSPACARMVAAALETMRPACVLIEGPSDFNGRLAELRLGHELPIAVFSYKQGQGASWTPFCEYSPEWVALNRAPGEVRFMDLPAWHAAMRDRPNRYSDRHSGSDRDLARELGFDDPDALWDHLFEAHPPEESRLQRYFEALRCDPSPEDAEREAFMRRCLGWARARFGDSVLVVCGGFHAPALHPEGEDWPELAAEEGTGSYLVPFSFHRLDSFAGYAAGMPSPGYYQHAWEGRAPRELLGLVAQRLRQRKLLVSSADLIAADTLAQGLARLRGHPRPLRADLLDGLVGALVKEALVAPLPWSRRGVLPPETDPLLVELVAAFSGDRRGRLHPDTPLPPLVADALSQLRALQLEPTRPARQVTVEQGSERSHCLHRLALLELPGFQKLRETELEEDWSLQESLELHAALVEASVHGSDLESAATAVLQEALEEAADSLALARLLLASRLAGLRLELDERVGRALAEESDLGVLGAALQVLFRMYRRGAALDRLLASGFSRGLWLFEALEGSEPPIVSAVAVLRDLDKLGRGLDLPRDLARGVMGRRLHDGPIDCRGAALGYLWSLELGPGEEEAMAAVRGLSPPEVLGDFLHGLFALAREEVQRSQGLIELLDRTLAELDRPSFLRALPGLRLAFGQLPPRERQAVAAVIARLRGLASAHDLLRVVVSPDVAAAGMQLEHEVEETIARYGL